MNIGVVGSLNIDLVSHVRHLPKAGETISSYSFETIPGGKGANQAVAASRLGANVYMIGRVGNDSYGEILLENLKASGVHTEGVQQEGTTGMAFINVSDSGENNIVLVPGANAQMTNEDIDKFGSILEMCEMILVQLEIPLNVVEYVVKRAAEWGKKVILNPAPAQKLSPEVLKTVYTVTPNETELEMVTGMPTETIPQVVAAAKQLLAMGAEQVIVTMGERGALLVRKEAAVTIPAYKVAAVDTTAAGDSYTAAFAVGKGNGMSDAEAAAFAAKVAAIVVTRKGAQPSLPTLDEVNAFTFLENK